ncbi:MAG TPA: hypothetical protein VF166_08325 [Gemmatimonadaceae bacterium]
MSALPVLVIATDIVIGALLASLAELAGYTPVFPALTERPLEAITRLRPPLVLLDCDHDLACEDEAYARAAETGSRIILFTASSTLEDAERMAAQRGVTSFAFPIHYQEFARRLRSAMES